MSESVVDGTIQRCSSTPDAVVSVGATPMLVAGPERSTPLSKRLRGDDCVDQAPVDGLLAFDAFGPGGEHVGEVAADVAFVDDAGEPTGAGQHCQQRNLGKRHGRRTVVDQDDLVACEREFVAATGGSAVHRSDVHLARVGRGVFDRVAGFVGELAEVHLVAVGRLREHLNVRSGAEHLVEAAGDDDGSDFRMFESQSLHGVVQFDVDAEVVTVELQLVAVAQTPRRIDLHSERRDRPVEGKRPVSIQLWLAIERDVDIRHRRPPSCVDPMLQRRALATQGCRAAG